MTVPRVAILSVLGLALAISVVTDVRSRKIYNWVTLPAMAIGVALHVWASFGVELSVWAAYGWKSSLAGLAAGFGVFLGAHLAGGMGEGDVKLMGAVGALLGLQVTLVALVTVALAGGGEALATRVWRRTLGRTIAGMARDVAARVGLAEREERERQHIPYGVAIAAGTAWALWWTRGQEAAMSAALRAASN